jgi:hypothetical protein
MASPTLSVIMPNYNHGRFIPEALQAVLDQSRLPSEIIFIDDRSTDNSLEVVSEFASKHSIIKVIKNDRNRGIIYNLNLALEMATGDYVVGTACDDRILPGFFEKSLDLLAKHPQAGLCSGLSRVMDEKGNDRGILPGLVVSDRPAYFPPERTGKMLRSFGNWMTGNTTIYRREALLEAGMFNPRLYSFCDNFAAQVIVLKHGACFIPEPLGVWRSMDSTYSTQCRSNLDLMREMVTNATTLMETQFRGVFPPGYAQAWKKDMAFESARVRLRWRRAKQGAESANSRDARPTEPGGKDRPASGLEALTDRIPLPIATAYFLLKHRPGLAVRRRFIWLLSTKRMKKLGLA